MMCTDGDGACRDEFGFDDGKQWVIIMMMVLGDDESDDGGQSLLYNYVLFLFQAPNRTHIERLQSHGASYTVQNANTKKESTRVCFFLFVFTQMCFMLCLRCG